MKFETYMELQRLFGGKKDKPKKEKKLSIVKEFIKFKKELKEFEEWEKSQKKDDKKKSGWDEMSTIQKLVILQMTVPFMVAFQLILLATPIILIAKLFH